MKHLRTVAKVLFIACLVSVCVSAAVADEVIGVIRISDGTSFVIRNKKFIPAVTGAKLFVGDTLDTAAGGSIGVVLRDNSIFSIGPDSSLHITKFQFDPAGKKLGLVARLSRGTLEYVSGGIGKLAPESVRFEMPAATIHTRGTHFLMKAEGAAVL